MFDIGCGSGGYVLRHDAWSGGCIERYTGADIRASAEWERVSKEHSHISFVQLEANGVLSAIPEDTNLIVSQSAIEHVEEDLTLFRQLRTYIRRYRGDVLQIHLVPARSGYESYPFHGVRQYTPRTLSRITRLFTPDSDAALVSLGGAESNRVHRDWILGPDGDRREGDEAAFDRACFEAIQMDMRSRQAEPAFYALILDTRANEVVAGPCSENVARTPPRSLGFIALGDTGSP